MQYVKFSPSKNTPDEMMQQSEDCETGLTTNAATLPTPPVTVSALATQRGIVNTKQNEMKAAQLLVEQKAAELAIENKVLGNKLSQVATYVDGIAIANSATAAAIVSMGGFDNRKTPVYATTPPPAPQNFSVTLGDVSGSADLHWDPLQIPTKLYKVYYNVESPTAPFNASTWKLGNSTGISSLTLTGLPIHTPIAFCVVANNPNGDGPPSAIVVKTLL